MFDQQTNCLLLTPFPVSFFFGNKKIGTASQSLGPKNLVLYSPHRSQLAQRSAGSHLLTLKRGETALLENRAYILKPKLKWDYRHLKASHSVIPNYCLLPFLPGILNKPTKEKCSAVRCFQSCFSTPPPTTQGCPAGYVCDQYELLTAAPKSPFSSYITERHLTILLM